MRVSELLEALKPSQYRGLVKDWDKTRYETIFKRYASDRNAYRIYVPLKGEAERVRAPSAIEKAVIEAGYEIEDYATGIASKDGGKRKVKIGKILKDPLLLKQFANDPKRGGAKRSDYVVVISRHPYDVAGMSTDRGWTSCMNLDTGVNRHYVPADVKEGTIVAYLIKGDDRNISSPAARMLIKPFYNPGSKDIALGIEDRVYGTDVPGFARTVRAWVDEVNDSNKLDGMFVWNEKLYRDTGFDSSSDPVPRHMAGMIFRGPRGEMLKKVLRDQSSIAGMALTDEDMLAAIVATHGGALQHIKNPPKKVVMAALKRVPNVIRFVKDQTEEMQLEAARNGTSTLGYFDNPTERVKAAMLSKNGYAIMYFDNPSEEHQLLAVKQDPSAIKHIKKPTEKVMLAALKRDPASFSNFPKKDGLPESVYLAAVKAYPGLVNTIKDPSEAVKRAAARARKKSAD